MYSQGTLYVQGSTKQGSAPTLQALNDLKHVKYDPKHDKYDPKHDKYDPSDINLDPSDINLDPSDMEVTRQTWR